MLTAGLYVARYLPWNRHRARRPRVRAGAHRVGQTSDSVAIYRPGSTRPLYGGMTIAAPTILIDDATLPHALSQMNGRLGGGASRIGGAADHLRPVSTVAQKTFALEAAYKMNRHGSWRPARSTPHRAGANETGVSPAAIQQLAVQRSGRDTTNASHHRHADRRVRRAALASVFMVVRIPRDIAAMVRGAVGDSSTPRSR